MGHYRVILRDDIETACNLTRGGGRTGPAVSNGTGCQIAPGRPGGLTPQAVATGAASMVLATPIRFDRS
ncbi:MAG: hypothetical protein CMO04_19175 [Thalassospira sp.]|nr:hypothetical protein [Thalassospira sp.]